MRLRLLELYNMATFQLLLTTDESRADDLLEQTNNVSNLNSSQVEQLVSQLADLLSGPTVSLALGNTSVRIVSNLLDATPETLSSSSDRLVMTLSTACPLH